MKAQFVIIFLAMLVDCGPEQKKFDPSTWNEMDDFFYANRESMVRDLMDEERIITPCFVLVAGSMTQR